MATEHGIVVGPDTPDKLRSFEQTTGAGIVQSEAVALVDPDDVSRYNKFTDEKRLQTSDSKEEEYTHVVATLTSAGDTVVYTPAAGKAVRVRSLYAVPDPVAVSSALIKIKLGALEIYRVWALSTRQRKTGPVNGALTVNLTGTGNIAFTAILEEV